MTSLSLETVDVMIGMMPDPIPFIKPKLPEPDELAADLRRIYDNNYYSNNGPVYFEFQKAIQEYLGQDIKAVLVSNATLGIMIAIQATIKNKNPNKKYIAIPSFTFAAGPLAIKWCGYEPVYFDIDLKSAQPGLESFRRVLEAYGEDLAGAVLVNNFGIGSSTIEEWDKLLKDRNVPYIIDSAPGFGSTYSDGSLIGGYGECEVFSFHATKPFGIGEGGLITTKNPDLVPILESLKNFGFDESKQTTVLGLNAKITELDCAIGLRILGKYEDTLADRRKTYDRFEKNLTGHSIDFLPRASSAAIQFATIVVEASNRPKVLHALKDAGVEARTYYAPAVHTFPVFNKDQRVSLANTEEISGRVVSLPVHPEMSSETVDHICSIIINSLSERA